MGGLLSTAFCAGGDKIRPLRGAKLVALSEKFPHEIHLGHGELAPVEMGQTPRVGEAANCMNLFYRFCAICRMDRE